MIIDLIVLKEDDGFTAYVPSLKGCDSWAHNEDDALIKAVELAAFYLSIDDPSDLKVDKARVQKNKSVYKLIFNKKPY